MPRLSMCPLIFVALLFLASPLPSASANPATPVAKDRWLRIKIADPLARHAVRGALDGATSWLADGRCETLLSEFRTDEGRPLVERLEATGVNCEIYLGTILFEDGSSVGRCVGGQTLAFTTPGSRVVYICASQFAHAWITRPALAKAIIIHEALHTLGLGENPPSSDFITQRVMVVCKPQRAPRSVGPGQVENDAASFRKR